MLKKIITVIASAALVVSGITPSFAASNANSQYRTWQYNDYNTYGASNNTRSTWTFDVSPGATRVYTSVDMRIGETLAQASVGKVLSAVLRLKKPNGEYFTGGTANISIIHNSTYPQAPYTIVNQPGELRTIISADTTTLEANVLPGGEWTAELTATLDGEAISYDATTPLLNKAYLVGQQFAVYGVDTIQTMPRFTQSLEYRSRTCVDTALVAPGDRLEFAPEFTQDGTTTATGMSPSVYTLDGNDYVQLQYDNMQGKYYVTWTDDLETKGAVVGASKYSNVIGSSSGSIDLSVQNVTQASEVSASCVAPVPIAPSVRVTSTYNGQIVFAQQAGVTVYEYQIVAQNDESTILDDGYYYTRYYSPVDGFYESYIYANFQVGTLYKARARAVNDVAKSAWSEWGTASGLIGPNAPDAPTLAISSTTSAKVTINKVQGNENTSNYRARIYNVNDRATIIGESMSWACSNSMTDSTKIECNVNAQDLVAPNQFVAVAQVKNNSGIYSAESADSNIVTGITAGYTLTGAPLSGLTTQGKARLVGDDVLGTLLNSSASKVSTTPDGLGGLYLANKTSSTEIKISKISGSTSTIDNSFGSSGYATVTIDANSVNSSSPPRVTWFGDSANRKWISTVMSDNGQFFAEGTASTTSATASEINVRSFCNDHFNDSDSDGDLRLYSAPTARPLGIVMCNLWGMTSQEIHAILVKVNQDGSITELAQMTPQGANDFYAVYTGESFGMPELPNSVNIAATGSETAIAIAIVNATYTPGNYSVNPPTQATRTAHSRALWRVPANLGTPTSTALTYTTNENLLSMGGPNPEPTFRLQPFNNGTKIYAMVLKNAQGCTYNPQTQTQTCATPSSYKLHETNVASGSLNADSAARTLTGSMSTQTEFQALVPAQGNVLQTILKSASSTCGQNGCVITGGNITPGAIDVTTGATVRGEMVNYSIGGSPVGAIWTNAAGKVQWLFTKPNATGHSLVEWQPVEIASAPVSVPTIVGGATGISLNAGGSKITITGTNLNLVTKVLFGTKEAKFTKTATSMSVTVPSGTTAGPVAVTVTYTGGQAAVPAGTWTYMGATKRAQTLTPTGLGDPTHSGASEADRNFSVASSIQGYNVTVVSKSPTFCTYVSGVIDFIGNGTCVLQAVQAGDAVTNTAIATYEIYYESQVNASALYSTDAGNPTITLTGEGLTSVSKVMFGDIEVVPTKKTANSITVKVPTAPTPGANVDVSLKYNNGTVVETDLSFDYVGAAKLSQTVSLVAGFSIATYGDAARTLTASSVDGASNALPGLPYVYATSTKTVCAITGDQLRFLTAGDCKVKATQAGNAGVNAAASAEFTITVALKSQTIEVDESARNITDAEGVDLGATNSNEEVLLEYVSSNELICTVDGEGFVTGLSEGSCTITINAPADARYTAATEKSVTVNVTPGADPLPDAPDVVEDNPISIANGGTGTFVSLSDPSLQVSWDKATGKLTPRATGVYTGAIVAELRFTRNGTNYVCTTLFGSTSKLTNPKKPTALPNNPTARQVAAYNKAMATYKAAYNKVWGSKVYASKNFCTDTTKLKSATVLNPFGSSFAVAGVKANKTTAEKNSEKAALNALKGFTGEVTITVKRWRAWPTTMKNKTGNAGVGKTIPATKNINTLTLG